MRVYVIGMHNSYSFNEHPVITSPYHHADFINELTKKYNMMSGEIGVHCRCKEKVIKIEDITEDFLLAQPTGKKIYINSRPPDRHYLYFIPYEILETELGPDLKLTDSIQLYHLGWLIEEAAESKPETQQEFQAIEPLIIHTDPLATTLRINTLLSDDPNKSAGYTLARLHQIVGEFMIYTYPNKWYKIRRCLMPVQ